MNETINGLTMLQYVKQHIAPDAKLVGKGPGLIRYHRSIERGGNLRDEVCTEEVEITRQEMTVRESTQSFFISKKTTDFYEWFGRDMTDEEFKQLA